MENDTIDYAATAGQSPTMGRIMVLATAAILFVGLAGNTFTATILIVTRRKKAKKADQYLLGLAIADLLFLLTLLVSWLRSVGIYWYDIPLVFNIVVYLSHVASLQSAWLLAAFTIERFIVISFPLKRHLICTSVKWARMSVAMLFLTACGVTAWIPFTSEVRSENDTDISLLHQVMNIVDAVLSFVLPTTLIFTLNLIIAIKMLTTKKVRALLISVQRTLTKRRLRSKLRREQFRRASRQCMEQHLRMFAFISLGHENCTKASSTIHVKPRTRSILARHRRHRLTLDGSVSSMDTQNPPEHLPVNVLLSKMTQANARRRRQSVRSVQVLLALSVVYLVLNSPSYIVRILINADRVDEESKLLVISVSYILFYLQFSVNFLLYSIYSRRFNACGSRRQAGQTIIIGAGSSL